MKANNKNHNFVKKKKNGAKRAQKVYGLLGTGTAGDRVVDMNISDPQRPKRPSAIARRTMSRSEATCVLR